MTKAFFLIAILLTDIPAMLSLQAQVKRDERFSRLPKDVQNELFQRMQVFVGKIQSEKWGEAYDDFWTQYINGVNGLNGATKGQYVTAKERSTKETSSKLIGFNPGSVRVVSFEKEEIVMVIIDGCGEYKIAQNTKHAFSSFTAILVDSHWYFTDISRATNCHGCQVGFCM